MAEGSSREGTPVPHDGGRDADDTRIVQVWSACFADVETAPDAWLRVLDPCERARLERLKRPRAALCYAGRQAMLRSVLGGLVGVAPERLRFREGAHGKPMLQTDDARRPRFSVSRTGEVAVVAVHRGADVGVDVETITRIEPTLAGLYTRDEEAALARLQEPARSEAILRAWVCREAVLKAAGYGLSIPLDRIMVPPSDGASDTVSVTLTAGHPSRYAVTLFRPSTTILGAVASERPVRPSLRWWRRCQCRAACSACTTSLIA